MKLDHVLDALRKLAPEYLADSWDRVGLHVGDAAWPIRRAMLCIDATEAVIDEAIAARVHLLVAYHPPIFEPLKAITAADPKQRVIMRAIREQLAIYSPHTALDAAVGGINDWLCQGIAPGAGSLAPPALSEVEGWARVRVRAGATGRPLGADQCASVRPIRPYAPLPDPARRLFKLITFVPPDGLDGLRQALFTAGAGHIGNYSECSFSVEGEGTFRGGKSTHPTIGRRGRLETVRERRLEIVVPGHRLTEVVAALRRAHPYEEPAFDLIALQHAPECTESSEPGASVPGATGVVFPQCREGQGRIVTISRPLTAAALVRKLRAHLGVRTLEVATPPKPRPLTTIGVCAGAGGSLLKEAGPIDAFVTGEMRHHDVLDAVSRGVTIILAGHTQTERPYLPTYRRRLTQVLGNKVTWRISRTDRPPLMGHTAPRA